MSPTINTGETVAISERVIEEVAAVTGTDPLEMEPLYSRVDPDCLESLFDDESVPETRGQGHIAFPMDGCQVVVRADETIDVTPFGELADAPSTAEHPTSSRAVESPD